MGYRSVDGSVKLKSKTIKKAVKGINNSLLSASFGTRVALFYGYRYPAAIARSVMVGVNPPGHFIWWPDQTEKIIDKYDLILKGTHEAAARISIKESIAVSFSKIPKRWTLFRLDAGKIKATSFVLLYIKQGAVMVFEAYSRAAINADYSGLDLMQLADDYLVPGMFTWGDLFNKGASADANPSLNYKELLKPEKYAIGAPLSFLIWGGGEYWPKMPNAKQIILEDMAHVDDLMNLQKDFTLSFLS